MKDFDMWNEQKKGLDGVKKNLSFKEREIWWCALGINIGEEVYGKGRNFLRPVLILKKLSWSSCVVIPITTKEKIGSWFRHIETDGSDRWAMMHQIRLISVNRLQRRIALVSVEQFQELKKSVALLLGLSEYHHRA